MKNYYAKLALAVIIGSTLYPFTLSIFVSIIGTCLGYLALGGWRFAWVVVRTLPRDLRVLFRVIKVMKDIKKWRRNDYTIPQIFKDTVKKHSTKTAIIFDDRKWTFKDIDQHTNSVANYFYNEGYRHGDVVAIYLDKNCFEFIGLWLGLAKIGVVSSLINYNIRHEQLLTCLNVSEAKAIIFGIEKSDEINEILPQLKDNVKLYKSGEGRTDVNVQSINLDEHIATSSTADPPSVKATINDKLFLIFTSGTTGLPKAAIISHLKFVVVSHISKIGTGIPDDAVIYNTLPLYHTSGTIQGVGCMVINGCTNVISEKFSASRFWTDCIKYQCTVAQYIGEVCRYLLAQPARPTDTQHKVRLMSGNGLQPELWQAFIDRFQVPNISEFYGSTEGNIGLMNMFGKPGSVGFKCIIVPWINTITLIRVNKETGEPLRDERGICIQCEIGEPGEVVGLIQKNDPVRQFTGYMNKSATRSKIITNVFKQGDMCFRSGDILVMDELGYLYFRDRTGDTFRWKGENVATAEVETIVSNILGLTDSAVYGVHVPGCEGKAGMAAIACQPQSIDLYNFKGQLEKSLAAYARPVFLRFCDNLQLTGTFKIRKVDLRNEAYNPKVVSDPMFYMNPTSRRFEPLTPDVFTLIADGKIRL